MADQPVTMALLTEFYRELIAPDFLRVFARLDDINARFDGVDAHFDDIYRRFDRLETEYQSLKAGLERVEKGRPPRGG